MIANPKCRPVRAITAERIADPICVGLIGIFVLLGWSRFLDISKMHIAFLTDQVVYISVARNFVETGTLQSNIIYPSVLWQNATKNYFYMPGHFLSLALSYALFGFGAFQSLLPSLASFVLATVGVFMIGRKIYHRRVGFMAALIFVLFPSNIFYTFSAMEEMTLVAAATLAFCGFTYLPERWRPWIAPAFLVVPFLFRETGALLVVPMALLILSGKVRRNLGRTILFVLLSVLLLVVIFKSDLSAGRPTSQYGRVFGRSFEAIYTDAVAQEAISAPTIWDWATAVPANVLDNTRTLLLTDTGDIRVSVSYLTFIVAMFMSLVYGLYNKESFLQASGGLILIVFLFVLGLWYAIVHTAIRMLLFTFPIVAVSMATLYDRHVLLLAIPGRRLLLPMLHLSLLVSALYVDWLSVQNMRASTAHSDAQDKIYTAFIKQIGHDDRQMLVTDPMFLNYVYRHHPVKWSFIPANRETLDLLAARYQIGTLVLPNPDRDSSLTREDLERIGLKLERTVEFENREYSIYQRPAS